ncbi:MAG: DNA polymerase/3'-5' exonuclease PolX [Acidiferrobacterales bacterium]|nr:DNA polymerase/3'-5' exonuclease PolX [Acidiferrobacterales bacterium]
MPIHNSDIAAIFDEIADLLEIEGANPFRVRAYRNAARTVQGLGRDAAALVEQEFDLTRLPGIGKDLASKIDEIVRTGRCEELTKLHNRTPAALSVLLKIPGLGPRRVAILHKELGINTPKQLLRAVRQGRIRELEGFGVKTEQRIREAIEAQLQKKARFLLRTATDYAQPLVEYLKQSKGVKDVVVAGSYRRCNETVGDLDILITATRSSPVMNDFVEYDEVKEVISHGKTRTTIILKCGLQVDVRVVARASLGAALQYFTGSKAHNIAIRRLGQQRDLKINEYGVFKGEKRVAGQTETSVYAAVKLPYIEPELRENRGEIDAARRGKLPKPVRLTDLKGDLHSHTRASDGKNTVAEMAQAARERGLRYLAITDHSKGLTVARGLNRRTLQEQLEEIDRLNDSLKGIELLKGIEVEILEDGRLDLPDAILAELDLVIGAVHSKFDLSSTKQTRRIVRAMNHSHFSVLAHPSGRLLEERKPYDVDMAQIIREASQRGCFLELNAQPQRLDLIDMYCQLAKDEGVLIAINSDAHQSTDFDNLCFGVGQARRGWLETKDVLNTRSLPALRKLLKRTT